MWQSEADSDSAPCSPWRMAESIQRTFSLMKATLVLPVSFSPTRVAKIGNMSSGSSGSFSMSNGAVKSMYLASSGSQKWSWVAEMILSKAVERAL